MPELDRFDIEGYYGEQMMKILLCEAGLRQNCILVAEYNQTTSQFSRTARSPYLLPQPSNTVCPVECSGHDNFHDDMIM